MIIERHLLERLGFIIVCMCIACACAENRENPEGDTLVPVVSENAMREYGEKEKSVKSGEKDIGIETDKSTEKRIKTRIVIDEMGKKRKLMLANNDVNKKGVFFYSVYFLTQYSQVDEGHFYYLTDVDGDETFRYYYAICRDLGHEVERFSINAEEEELLGIVKYRDKFYVLMESEKVESDENELGVIDPVGTVKLAYVDLKAEKLVEVSEIKDVHFKEDAGTLFCSFYQDILIYRRRTKWDLEEDRPGKLVFLNYEKDKCPVTVKSTPEMQLADPYLTYLDGGIYYGVQNGKNVDLYEYDMQSGSQRKFFSYSRKDKTNRKIFLSFDEKYIYCQEYIIPRDGGKMKKIFNNATPSICDTQAELQKNIHYAFNKKYIFYIDDNYLVHRVSKATWEDKVISRKKAVGLTCTENHVYVKAYDKVWVTNGDYDFDEEEEDPYWGLSHKLYRMNLEGKNRERCGI